MKIYQVGGSVRDKLMQKTPHDTDYVVTGASVEQMQQLGYRQVGKHFPVFIEPSSGDEYALAGQRGGHNQACHDKGKQSACFGGLQKQAHHADTRRAYRRRGGRRGRRGGGAA